MLAVTGGAVQWWHLGPAAALGLLAALVPAVLGPTFATPQVGAVDVVVIGPTAILSGVVGAFAVSAVLREPVATLPWVGPRDIRVWRMLRVVVLAGAIAVLSIVTSGSVPLAVLVCLASLIGEALLAATVLWEDVAWSVPLLHAGMVLTFGTDVFGEPHPWAWFLRPQPTWGDAAVAIALLVTGLVAWACRRPRS